MKACTIEKLSDFLETQFVSTDNIPEDTARRDSVCMEARASLLIEANCTGERFPAFMKCGRREDSCWIFPDGKVNLEWSFREFEVGHGQFVIDSLGHTTERWRLKVSPDSSARTKVNLK